MNQCKKDGRHDITVSSDGRDNSMPSQEEHGEINYDADDEGEEDSNNEEDNHTALAVKDTPNETLPNAAGEVKLASFSSSSCQSDPPSRESTSWYFVICLSQSITNLLGTNSLLLMFSL